MKKKIIEIAKKVPQLAVLPDGFYKGVCNGYIIHVEYEKDHYELHTEESIRGIEIPVVIQIQDGVATFEIIKNQD